MVSFGQRLKELREKKGMSQQKLAKLFNLSQSTFAYYELNKKQPSHKTLSHLADYFGVSTDYLLGRDSDLTTGNKAAADSYDNPCIDELINDLKYNLNHAISEGHINEDEGKAYLEVALQQLRLYLGQRNKDK